MSEVPDPTSTGVEGTQTQGLAVVPATLAPPMQISSVPDAIDGLLATHSRNLGGDVAARLLAASMRHTSNQLAAAHETISIKNSEEKAAIETITKLKVEIAELGGRLKQIQGASRTGSVCTFVGTALLGVAIDLYKSNVSVGAVLTGLLGVALLLFVISKMREESSK